MKIGIERKKKDIKRIYKKVESSEDEIYKLVDSLKEKTSGNPNRMKIGDVTYTGDSIRKAIISYYQEQGDPENIIFHDGFDQAELEDCQELIKTFMASPKVKNHVIPPVSLWQAMSEAPHITN